MARLSGLIEQTSQKRTYGSPRLAYQPVSEHPFWVRAKV